MIPKVSFPIAVALFVCSLTSQADLVSYVNRPDDSYSFKVTGTRPAGEVTAHIVQMTSQTWKGIVWTHWLTIFQPKEIKHNKGMLLVSGGDNTDSGPRIDGGESRIIAQIAQSTGTVTAVINQVPNQPLFDGLKEDGIISLTFEKYLNGEGDDWPLLFPMVKSAVRAMDTVQKFAKDELNTDVNEFMVLGGSKRGWTSWLSAVADKRVAAIAPVVIDVLNMVPQAELQLASYGTFSDEVQDYTQRNIQARMETPEGARLRGMVDPFSYCDTLTLPKLVVLGTNDPYWNVDSANNYFPYLKGDKYLYYCANTKHDVNPNGVATIRAFYQSMLTGERLPQIEWSSQPGGAVKVAWEHPEAKARLWKATSPNRDFRGSQWVSEELTAEGKTVTTKVDPPETGWVAYYVEVVHPIPGGQPFGLCTTMTVLPDTYPFPEAPKEFQRGTNADVR